MNQAIPNDVRDEIGRRLSAVEADETVRLLLAVESGSRAWGFPSPDSDYDARFIYVRPRSWYLGLEPGRDVIERPIIDEIDLNGWDIRKALGLMLKSNAVVGEWLTSPIRYRPDDPIVEELKEMVRRTFNPRGIAHHYANLGRNAAGRWLGGTDDVPVKRYFYALRPALAIRALHLDPAELPPMNLQDLMDASDITASVRNMVDELVEAKSRTRELGNARRVPELDRLIGEELSRDIEIVAREPSADDLASANRLFLKLVDA